jgi:cyanophycinase-like exopeptidase
MAERARKASPRRKGTLVIIGGREDHEGERVILREVASHIADGRLVLATIASHEPEGYLEAYQKVFAELGVPRVTELYVGERSEAGLAEKLEALADVHAVFFSGGDQLRITSQIGDTPIYERIHEIYLSGGLIAGTSAGAASSGRPSPAGSRGMTIAFHTTTRTPTSGPRLRPNDSPEVEENLPMLRPKAQTPKPSAAGRASATRGQLRQTRRGP